MLQQSIAGHKPLVDKLIKTGEALSKLCGEDDAAKVQDIVENDCDRYNALKSELRQRQQELEQVWKMIKSNYYTRKKIKIKNV